MKVLILYNIIPEEFIQAVVNLTGDQWKQLKLAHNYVINGSAYDEEQSAAVLKVNDAFLSPDKLDYAENEDWAGIFYNNKIEQKDGKPYDIKDVSKVIFCGYYL